MRFYLIFDHDSSRLGLPPKYRRSGLKMPQKCSEGSCRKRPISVETVRQYVAENRLIERDGLLLRGSAAMRGFAGCLDHSLHWLERFSPGVGVRFRGHTLKRWRRNTAAVRGRP